MAYDEYMSHRGRITQRGKLPTSSRITRIAVALERIADAREKENRLKLVELYVQGGMPAAALTALEREEGNLT